MEVVSDIQQNMVLVEGDTVSVEEGDKPAALPSGESVTDSDAVRAPKSNGHCEFEGEPFEKRRKTRRGKCRRKNPYSIDRNENQAQSEYPRRTQPEAPYNTNEFLMEDHNAFVTINSPPCHQQNVNSKRSPRVRDPSFTSVDTDDDHFYSSPEDEEEFLTKDFSIQYRDVHIENLQNLPKSELIQQLLDLEERLDACLKGQQTTQFTVEITDDDGKKINVNLETIKQIKLEVNRLRSENERLKSENQRLRNRNRSSSVSSVDSESDSSSSSPSSVGNLSHNGEETGAFIPEAEEEELINEEFNVTESNVNHDEALEEEEEYKPA